MNLTKVAGIVIVVGALIFIFAALPMTGIYGIQDADERIAKINADKAGFILSQALFAIGAVVTAIGFALLSVRLADSRGALLPTLGAIALLAGAALWVFFMYERTTDPEGYFRDYAAIPAYVWAYLALSAVGLAVYGFLFLAPGYPSLVGWLTLAVAGLTVVVAIATPQQVPPQLLYLPPLVIGAAVLWSRIPGPA